MFRITRKNAQGHYTAIQMMYWGVYGLIYSFASIYLLSRGFTNAQIGLVLGCAHLLSTMLQPAVAAAVERTGAQLMHAVVVLLGVIAAMGLMLYLLPLPMLLAAVCFMCTLAVISAIQSSLSALIQSFEAADVPVNFGFSRGLGSFVYAVVVAVMGRVLAGSRPGLLPLLYLCASLVMAAYLLLLRLPEGRADKKPEASKETSALTLMRRPWFALLMLATTCLALNAILVGSYLIQIMTDIGGGSTEMGIAAAIGACMECPAMLLYARISKRFGGDRRMLVLCGWVWAFKCGLIAVAQHPAMIFAAQFLQFAGYGFFVPANVRYVRQLLPEKAFLKGQSLCGSAFTAGSLIAAFGGGALLDAVGVRNTLYIGECFSIVGAVMLTLSVVLSRRERLQA